MRGVAAAAVALVLSLGAAALAQTSPYVEVQATPKWIPDYEFDTARNGVFCQSCNFGDGNSRFAFTANDDKVLWVGYVDFQTGLFTPQDGKGTFIAPNTAIVPDFGNGPEMMASTAGSQIGYTVVVDRNGDGTPVLANTHVGLAVQTGTKTWNAGPVGAAMRANPSGSKDTTDADPRFNFIKSDKTGTLWSRLSEPGIEVPMKEFDKYSNGNSRRWVPGTRKIIFQGHDPNETRLLLDQIFLYDTDTDTVETLTKDSVTKAGGFMWRAPEYNNEYLFFTMANFRQEIWVYRNIAAARNTRQWVVIKKIVAPANKELKFFFSPEVFTHNGRSYIFTQVSSSASFFDRTIPTHIALSGIDPLRTDLRVLTGNGPERLRLDPEYFISAKGPLIYFNRAYKANDQYPDGIPDGIWFVDTLLGPRKN